MYVHPTLMVTPEGQALGVIDAWTWARKAKGEADINESRRWIEGYGIVADRAQSQPNTRFVYVADREADSQELMEAARRREYVADYLIRAKHNRNLVGDSEFTLEATAQRKARKVRQTLYAQRVTLPRKKGKQALEVSIILACEENPPAGENPILWRLLSNRTVETLAQASEMINGYRRRWLIVASFAY